MEFGTRHSKVFGQEFARKWKADAKMIESINKLPGKKTMTERIVRKIMQAKKRFKL